MTASASSIAGCTLGPFACRCQPWKSVPSYSTSRRMVGTGGGGGGGKVGRRPCGAALSATSAVPAFPSRVYLTGPMARARAPSGRSSPTRSGCASWTSTGSSRPGRAGAWPTCSRSAGEGAFRLAEAGALDETTRGEPVVVATGGGTLAVRGQPAHGARRRGRRVAARRARDARRPPRRDRSRRAPASCSAPAGGGFRSGAPRPPSQPSPTPASRSTRRPTSSWTRTARPTPSHARQLPRSARGPPSDARLRRAGTSGGGARSARARRARRSAGRSGSPCAARIRRPGRRRRAPS